MTKTRNWITFFAALIAAAFFITVSVFAKEAPEAELTLSAGSGKLSNGSETDAFTASEITVTSAEPLSSLYLIYSYQAVDFEISDGDQTIAQKGLFLHRFLSLTDLFGEAKREVNLRFSEPVALAEIYGFFPGALPDWVQIWKEAENEADLCLFSTHADDEQLFFAGVLPYYAGEKGMEVQVVYLTDHKNEPGRRHELLNGLWTVGVTRYPVIGILPDAWNGVTKTLEYGYENALSKGITKDDLVAFQTEMLRRFKPLVVVGHDVFGEYGHPQHQVNCDTLIIALENSADASFCPASAAQYGVWDTPKAYLHLYGENAIYMDWDDPLARFNGKTAFEMTQEGFSCHKSQQYTWFRTWIFGSGGEIRRASQIKTYSPCCYGLYRTLVGADEEKNDFFEHLLTRKEAEELERVRAEKAEERIALLRQKNDHRAFLLNRLEEAALFMKADEKSAPSTAVAACVAVLAVLALIPVFGRTLAKRRKGRKK